MDRLLLVCLGGALGSGARYLVGVWAEGKSEWPIGTWIVNVVGSFILGAMAAWLTDSSVPVPWRLGLTAGLMGGFTTYSTFSLETAQFIEKGAYGTAALNVAVTLVVCLLATFAGLAAGRALSGA